MDKSIPISDIPKELLFHYTSQQGLIGIVSTKTLWATDIRYLNDAKEFQYSIDLAQIQLQQLKESVEGKTLQHIAQRLSDMGAVSTQPRFYVSCFSSNGDQLSQWRAYSTQGSGFSVGFDFSNLQAAIEQQQFKLVRCIYDPREQDHIVADAMAQVVARIGNLPSDSRRSEDATIEDFLVLTDAIYGALNEFLLPVAPILKHPKFSEEQEWRLVSPRIYTNSEQVHFREGKSMIIPYVKFKLPDENTPPYIPEIVVGPTPHPEHSQESVFDFVSTRLAIENPESPVDIPVRVRLSEIPYRGW